MSEIKLISPMLDGFSVGEPYSNHHGVSCYPAMPGNSDSKYIVKVISIPASQTQLQALLLTGAYQNEAAARDYFLELAQDIIAETDVLRKLSKQEGFLPFEDHQIVPKENEVGYDVYLLGSYRRSLARHLRKTNMTHLAAINLGLDLCAALTVSRNAGYLFADLKPENIFICHDREFRVCDLGFLKLDSLRFTSMPERFIGTYTAPEIVDAFSDINPTIDVYSAGLILYQVYNGGALPFDGRATAEELPAPAYADYELAEIILKACAPDPKDRWQNPYEMGQALVAYMQRNGVNDTPIVTSLENHDPLPETPADEEAPTAEETAEAAEETAGVEQICLDDFYQYLDDESQEDPSTEESDKSAETVSEEPAAEEEDYLNLSFLDGFLEDSDGEDPENFSYRDVSEDASSILSMADDLLEERPQEVSEDAASEPEKVIPMSEVAGCIDGATRVVGASVAVEETTEEASEEEPFEEEEEEYDDDDIYEDEEDEDGWPEGAVDSSNDEETNRDMKAAKRKSANRKAEKRRSEKKKRSGKLIAWICVLLLLCGLAVGGYLFYRDYYLRNVTVLTLEGNEDQLIVRVAANLDESQLTVYCVDTYGNPMSSPVQDGKAVFNGLNPNTLYRVKVEVSGLHKLTGKIEDSYTTPVQTDILTFTAVAGNEPGTAILTFTLDGMDSSAWSVSYWAEGEQEQKAIFGGHTVNISGLVSGKTYTFQLEAGSDLYITGNDRIEYTVLDPVFAENLAITAATADSLDVSWTVPEGAQVAQWTVRCYSDSGYDQTIVTDQTVVTFTGLNGNEAHTVEVLAEGMSSGNRCYMTANAVTVNDVTASKSNNNLILTWDYTGNTPTGQWIITYNVDGAAHSEMVSTNTNSATLSPLVPGAEYTVTILLEDGTTVFTRPFTVTAPEAERFSGYLINADLIVASMCKTPDKANWSRADLKEEDYTDTFKAGSKASFLLHSKQGYDPKSDVITTMFVIHDENGTLISSNITQETWRNMWYKRYCELDVPALPDIPGTYSIAIYFNGAFVHSQNFYVTEG